MFPSVLYAEVWSLPGEVPLSLAYLDFLFLLQTWFSTKETPLPGDSIEVRIRSSPSLHRQVTQRCNGNQCIVLHFPWQSSRNELRNHESNESSKWKILLKKNLTTIERIDLLHLYKQHHSCHVFLCFWLVFPTILFVINQNSGTGDPTCKKTMDFPTRTMGDMKLLNGATLLNARTALVGHKKLTSRQELLRKCRPCEEPPKNSENLRTLDPK